MGGALLPPPHLPTAVSAPVQNQSVPSGQNQPDSAEHGNEDGGITLVTPRGSVIKQRRHTLLVEKDEKGKPAKKKWGKSKDKHKEKKSKHKEKDKDKPLTIARTQNFQRLPTEEKLRKLLDTAEPGKVKDVAQLDTLIHQSHASSPSSGLSASTDLTKTRPGSTIGTIPHLEMPDEIDWEAREEEDRVRNIMGKVVLPMESVLSRKDHLARLQKTSSGRFLSSAKPAAPKTRDRGIIGDGAENPQPPNGDAPGELVTPTTPLRAVSAPVTLEDGLRMKPPLPPLAGRPPINPPAPVPANASPMTTSGNSAVPPSPHEPTTAPPRPSVPPVSVKPILKPRVGSVGG